MSGFWKCFLLLVFFVISGFVLLHYKEKLDPEVFKDLGAFVLLLIIASAIGEGFFIGLEIRERWPS
jgi:hypothetical protein